MNLFFTITAYPPSIGGAQTNLHQLCRRLATHHSVQVANFWSSNRTDWLLGTTWNAPGGSPYTLDDVKVLPINYSRTERIRLLPWVMGYYLWQSEAIQRISRSLLPKLRAIAGTPDMIHHGRIGREPLAFASLALARELNIPFVLTAYHHPRWNGWLYRQYHHLYRQADAVIALTNSEAETLTRLGVDRNRIHVSGTGAELSEIYDRNSFRQKYNLNDKPLVLFIGQKYAYKGFEKLLKAAQRVWTKHPETHFLFVGPRTTYSRTIFNQIHDPRILELGVVSLEEKTSALAACNMLCLPSTQECFGGVFIEAWKMGKPVIGTSIPAISNVITDGVDGFVGPADEKFFADKISQLLDDPSLADHLGEAGKKKVERHYEWSALVERVEDVYSQLIGTSGLYKRHGQDTILPHAIERS